MISESSYQHVTRLQAFTYNMILGYIMLHPHSAYCAGWPYSNVFLHVNCRSMCMYNTYICICLCDYVYRLKCFVYMFVSYIYIYMHI